MVSIFLLLKVEIFTLSQTRLLFRASTVLKLRLVLLGVRFIVPTWLCTFLDTILYCLDPPIW